MVLEPRWTLWNWRERKESPSSLLQPSVIGLLRLLLPKLRKVVKFRLSGRTLLSTSSIPQVSSLDRMTPSLSSTNLRSRRLYHRSRASFASFGRCSLGSLCRFWCSGRRSRLAALNLVSNYHCRPTNEAIQCSTIGFHQQDGPVSRHFYSHHLEAYCRAGSNPFRVIEQLRNKLKLNAAAVQVPIGSEDALRGVVDIVRRKAIYNEGVKG